MARVLFLLLVLANLLFFVWAAGYLGGSEEGREPERLKAQVQPERLKVTVRDDKERSEPSPSPSSPSSAAEPVPTQTSSISAALAEAGKEDKSAPPVACRRIGPLPKADADKLAAAFIKAGGKVEKSGTSADGNTYWVHIPATDVAQATTAELRQAGISDFFVASEGPNKGAISLGVFHREEIAKDLLKRLHDKGIKTARMEAKPRKTDRLVLDVQAPVDVIERQLAGQRIAVANCRNE